MRALVVFGLVVACSKPASPEDASPPIATASASAVVAPTATTTASASAAPMPTAATAPVPTHSPAVHASASAERKGVPVPKPATYTCKPGEVDNGEACFQPCTADKDCAKAAKCQPMMIGNPNGGTSTAMVCQKP